MNDWPHMPIFINLICIIQRRGICHSSYIHVLHCWFLAIVGDVSLANIRAVIENWKCLRLVTVWVSEWLYFKGKWNIRARNITHLHDFFRKALLLWICEHEYIWIRTHTPVLEYSKSLRLVFKSHHVLNKTVFCI